jgi:hypothetical protein
VATKLQKRSEIITNKSKKGAIHKQKGKEMHKKFVV